MKVIFVNNLCLHFKLFLYILDTPSPVVAIPQAAFQTVGIARITCAIHSSCSRKYNQEQENQLAVSKRNELTVFCSTHIVSVKKLKSILTLHVMVMYYDNSEFISLIHQNIHTFNITFVELTCTGSSST